MAKQVVDSLVLGIANAHVDDKVVQNGARSRDVANHLPYQAPRLFDPRQMQSQNGPTLVFAVCVGYRPPGTHPRMRLRSQMKRKPALRNASNDQVARELQGRLRA